MTIVTVVDLGATDRQKLDDIIARLDTLIPLANSTSQSLADISAKLDQSGANQAALYQATSESGANADQRLVMAAISGAHYLVERMKRDHFDLTSAQSAAKLTLAQNRLNSLIEEVTNEQS